ncbi:iron-containing alcohol dehydrogenase [Feifania hominis]|uniref:Iron-containing alcohol dehydrogenase n=1 Tax=Feifania hominis TaxID=2763660 RepID=A0A926HVK1_9FIRM|nr:iron-containing alcohol dehydrogenase [Feifania hominis]MBC8536706.1 iron-containing alcohol dehydrogenase [Feifania hominis]
MIRNFNYFIPTRVVFGPGCLEQLATIAMPGKKAILVTFADLSMSRLGYVERIVGLLKKQNIDVVVFEKVLTNPLTGTVDEGVALMKQEGCDFIIALGGGSPIDTSKAMSVAAANGGRYWDYVPAGTGGRKPVEKSPLPVVAINTTAGTGSEVTPIAVITNPDTNEKVSLRIDELYPRMSFIDPELMLSLPKGLTAFQGLDAFLHAAEGYISRQSQFITDRFALEAVRLVYQNLGECVNNGKNLEARTSVALASTLAGMVIALAGCITEHSMEHPISAHFPRVPHGAGLALIFEQYFTKVVEKGTVNDRLIELAQAMGVKVEGTDEAARAMCFVRAGVEMLRACGIDRISHEAFGIENPDVDQLTEDTFGYSSGNFVRDPYELTRDDVREIFTKSLLEAK